jgi:hypothetical protein
MFGFYGKWELHDTLATTEHEGKIDPKSYLYKEIHV